MQILVHLHLERIEEDPGYSWWAESDDLAGFSAAADSLAELLRRVNAAVPEIVAQAGADPTALDIIPRLVIDQDARGEGELHVSAGEGSDDWEIPLRHGAVAVGQVAVSIPG